MARDPEERRAERGGKRRGVKAYGMVPSLDGGGQGSGEAALKRQRPGSDLFDFPRENAMMQASPSHPLLYWHGTFSVTGIHPFRG